MSSVVAFDPNQEDFEHWLTHLPVDMVLRYAMFFAGVEARSAASTIVDEQVYNLTQDGTYGDVARRLGCSEKSVQKRVTRCRKRLAPPAH